MPTDQTDAERDPGWENRGDDGMRRLITLASAIVLAALIVGVRILLGSDVDQPILILLAVPIALVAAEFGVAGGLIAAALAVVALIGAHIAGFGQTNAIELATRTYIFATTGALVGHLTSSLRAARASEVDALVEAAATRKVDARLRMHSAEVAALADATSELVRSASADDSRLSICEALHRALGAQFVVLYESDTNGGNLVATASRGVQIKGSELSMASRSFGPVRAFSRGESIFLPEVLDRPGMADELEQAGARAILWQPTILNDEVVGVIELGWVEAMESLPERLESMARTLSVEAAIAIERAHHLEELERMARTDELTGLANRRAWDEELSRELSRARRQRHSVCVSVLDLDEFKDYNDRLGHQAGDRLLKQTATAWLSELREHDTLARYGGDEFGLILPGCSPLEGRELVSRLRRASQPDVGCSAGLAAWDGVESADALIRRADASLYQAKRNGRGRTVVAFGTSVFPPTTVDAAPQTFQ